MKAMIFCVLCLLVSCTLLQPSRSSSRSSSVSSAFSSAVASNEVDPRAPVSLGEREVILSEVNWAGVSGVRVDSSAEYVELWNAAESNIDLSGCRLVYSNLAGTYGKEYLFPEGSRIGSNGFFVVFLFAGPGAIYSIDRLDFQVCTNLPGLNNSGFTLRLLDGNGKSVDGFTSGTEGFPLPGSSDTNARSSMERRLPPTDGNLAASWRASEKSLNILEGFAGKTAGSPGAANSRWIIGDENPPILHWLTPRDGGTNRGGFVLCEAFAEDGGDLFSIRLSASNGSNFLEGETNLMGPANLLPGWNFLTLSARDTYGNEATEIRSVFVITDAESPPFSNFQDFEEGLAGWTSTNGILLSSTNAGAFRGSGYLHAEGTIAANGYILYSGEPCVKGNSSQLAIRIRGVATNMPLLLRAGASNCYWKINDAALSSTNPVSPSGSASYSGGGFNTLGMWKTVRLHLSTATVPEDFELRFRGGGGGNYSFDLDALDLEYPGP